MTILESVETGIKCHDLSPVSHYLGTHDTVIAEAVENILFDDKSKSSEIYNAMLAMAFCKKKGRDIFSPQIDQAYDRFVIGLSNRTT